MSYHTEMMRQMAVNTTNSESGIYLALIVCFLEVRLPGQEFSQTRAHTQISQPWRQNFQHLVIICQETK